MYFIYPSFILLGIYGISFLFKIKNKQYRLYSTVPVIAIIAITFIHLSLYMVRNHPFQNVYFNNLLSHDEQYLRKNFEMDYWGASYKQAFEYMLDNDKSCKINVAIAQTCGYDNAMILKKDNRERIIFVDKTEDAGYFISDYRSHPNDYDYNASKKVFNVKILNSDVISVWKLK
jgi:hypothetical protein